MDETTVVILVQKDDSVLASDWSFILINDRSSFDWCRVVASGVWFGACNGFHTLLGNNGGDASSKSSVPNYMSISKNGVPANDFDSMSVSKISLWNSAAFVVYPPWLSRDRSDGH